MIDKLACVMPLRLEISGIIREYRNLYNRPEHMCFNNALVRVFEFDNNPYINYNFPRVIWDVQVNRSRLMEIRNLENRIKAAKLELKKEKKYECQNHDMLVQLSIMLYACRSALDKINNVSNNIIPYQLH